MKRIAITLEIEENAKKAIPSVMKELNISSTEYSYKPKERLMLWGDALSLASKIESKLRGRGYKVRKLPEGRPTPKEKVSMRDVYSKVFKRR